MIRYAANSLTTSRGVGAGILLLLTPLSGWFWVCYFLCGLTDVMDGYVARKTQTTSTFGARLDSACDVLFWMAVLVQLFPILAEQYPYSVVIGLMTAGIRITSYGVGWLKYRAFVSIHSWLNKGAGVALFFLPLLLAAEISWGIPVVCAFVLLSAVEELSIMLTAKEYHPNRKGLWERTGE